MACSRSLRQLSDVNFVTEPPDELKCRICLEVAKNPRQHEACGKLFCTLCIEKYGKEKPCPNCKRIGSKYYVDHKSQRDIDELPVRCSNLNRSCEWAGTVAMLENHKARCEYNLTSCPRRCKDENNRVKFVLCKNLHEHLKHECSYRNYICEYCGEEGTYKDITEVHCKECPERSVPCPNEGCTAVMLYQDLEEHFATECEYALVPCRFERLGCNAKLTKQVMVKHEEDYKFHMCMAFNLIVRLESTTVKLERHLKVALEKIDKLESTVTTNMKPITFKLTDYHRRKNRNQCVDSPPAYVTTNGYLVAVRVYPNGSGNGAGTHVSLSMPILKGKYDAKLKWPLAGFITYTLLNQLEDRNHHHKTLELLEAHNVRVGSDWGYSRFIPHSKLRYNEENNTQYLKDDTLYFRLLVEPEHHRSWLDM